MNIPVLGDRLRYFVCWLFAVSAAFFLMALIVPLPGRWNDGKPWVGSLILIAIPSVYGGVMGFGMRGPAPWRILMIGGALMAPALLRGFPDFIEAFAMAAAAPAPATALCGWIARRKGLSPNARLGAALALAGTVAGLFALAAYLKWVPQSGVIYD